MSRRWQRCVRELARSCWTVTLATRVVSTPALAASPYTIRARSGSLQVENIAEKKGKEKKSSQHFTESKLRAYCFETFQDESCTESSRFSWRTVTIAIFGRYSVTCFVTCFFYTTNDEQRLNASKDITFLHLQEMDTYTNRHQNVTAIDTDALLSLAFFRKRNILICERVSWRITRRQLSGDRRSLLTYPERFVKCVVHVRAVFDRRDNIF